MRLDGSRTRLAGRRDRRFGRCIRPIIVGRPVRLRSPHDREIVRLALPALGALAAEPLYVLADTAIVGHLGRPQIAALGLAGTVLAGAFTIFNFLTYGTTAVVARASGAGRQDEAARLAAQALWASLGIGVVAARRLRDRRRAAPRRASAATASPATTRSLLPDRGDRTARRAHRARRPGLPPRRLEPPPAARDRRRRERRQPRPRDPVRLRLPLGDRRLGRGNGDRAGRDGRRLRRRAAPAARAVAAAELAGDEAALPHRQADLRPHRRALRLASSSPRRCSRGWETREIGAHQIAYQLFLFIALVLDAVAIAGQVIVGRMLGAGDADGAYAAAVRMIGWSVAIGLVFAAGARAALARAARGVHRRPGASSTRRRSSGRSSR